MRHRHFLRFAISCFFFLFLFLFAARGSKTPSDQEIRQEAAVLLQQIIRLNTTNPPGNETLVAKHIQQYFQKFGIPSEIVESVAGRGNILARLKGDGSRKPVLLLAHEDVVGADEKEWDVPPFEGKLQNGVIHGRGALDDKGMLVMNAVAFALLKRQDVPLKRDVIFLATADEEAGGEAGVKYIVENHFDRVDAEYVLNEGSFGIKKLGFHTYPVQVAEKGVAWLKLTVKGTSGHGSMPTKDNPVARLIEALSKLNAAANEMPITLTPITEAFLSAVKDMVGVKTNISAEFLANSDPAFNAIFRNTISPTVLKAGYKTNVIPPEAYAEVDCRLLPGETPEKFLAKIKEIINDKKVNVEYILSSYPNESSYETEFFEAIKSVMTEEDPKAVVFPYISAGATDSLYFRQKGVVAYGFAPALMAPEEVTGIHGKNEKISVENLFVGAKRIYKILKRFCGT